MVPFLGEASNEIMVSMEFREVLTLKKKVLNIHTETGGHTHRHKYFTFVRVTLLPCLASLSKTLKLKRYFSIS